MPSDGADFDPRPYADGLRALNAKERIATATRAGEARIEASRLAETIGRSVPGTRRVILFGSLLTDVPANPTFDIDLAIDGGDIYEAMAICEPSPWAIDIVSLDHLAPGIASRIEATGLPLFPLPAPPPGR